MATTNRSATTAVDEPASMNDQAAEADAAAADAQGGDGVLVKVNPHIATVDEFVAEGVTVTREGVTVTDAQAAALPHYRDELGRQYVVKG